jgi:HSP20 family molecular chaperone IbpA
MLLLMVVPASSGQEETTMLMRFAVHDSGCGVIDLNAWPTLPVRASEWTGFARRDTDDAVIYTLDVPRYRKKDLSVEVDGRRVTVRGQRNEGLIKPKVRRQFVRSFTLPETLDPSGFRADLQDGVLSLTVAKQPAARARRIAVQVAGKPSPGAAEPAARETQPQTSFFRRILSKLRAA